MQPPYNKKIARIPLSPHDREPFGHDETPMQSPCVPIHFVHLWQLLYGRWFPSSTGQWLPADPVMWQGMLIQFLSHCLPGQGCVGRERTPGQTLVELTMTNSRAQPLPTVYSALLFHIMEGFLKFVQHLTTYLLKTLFYRSTSLSCKLILSIWVCGFF